MAQESTTMLLRTHKNKNNSYICKYTIRTNCTTT